MVRFDKAVHDGYWWSGQGDVYVDSDSVESVQAIYKRTPGGNDSFAYTLITTKSGKEHHVMGGPEKVIEMLWHNG
jgi:hypothetical protein